MGTDTAARLWDVVEPYLAQEHVELDDLELRGRGKSRVLKITVDAEGGVDLDHITELARGISRLLDEAADLQGPYTLEVSSPGLERSLRRPAQYRKALGREVKIKTAVPIAGTTSHRGIVASADDNGLVLSIGEQDRRIEFRDIAAARTVFTWDRGAKPGKRG